MEALSLYIQLIAIHCWAKIFQVGIEMKTGGWIIDDREED